MLMQEHIEYDDFGEYWETIEYVRCKNKAKGPHVEIELVVADYYGVPTEEAEDSPA